MENLTGNLTGDSVASKIYAEWAANAERAALKERYATDPHRPLYHFLPPSNWINDPNGVIHWQGQYHLFYQYNPLAPDFGLMVWGHAVSPDLVHWTDLPLALEPTSGGPDASGCWSGIIVDNGGVPTAIYTGKSGKGKVELPCLAFGGDNLVSWQKYAGNPILAHAPDIVAGTDFRDHTVWRESDTWYMGIGTGLKDGVGAVLLFSSPDLYDWTYLHPLYQGEANPKGEVFECPSFFQLGDKHLLIFSPISNFLPVCLVGTYTAERRFEPESQDRIDYGGKTFYAPQTFEDTAGRRLMWGWLREGRSREENLAAGWAGVMSLPIQISLDAAGRVGYTFAPETEALRGANVEFGEQPVTGDHLLENLQGDTLEIDAEFLPGTAASFGLILRASPDGQEQTRLVYEAATGRFSIDASRSRLDGAGADDSSLQATAYTLESDQSLRFHVFLDRSVIEVSVNERIYMSGRIYPTGPDSQGVGVFAAGGAAVLKKLNAWQIGSIWE